MDLQTKYRINNQIKLRREKFGGIIYNHESGTLQFIHSHIFVKFLENDGQFTIQEMADKIFAPKKAQEQVLKNVMTMLTNFYQRGIIYEV